jgi:uncharacterized Fe-S cluster-containing radical SAM superfamily protein
MTVKTTERRVYNHHNPEKVTEKLAEQTEYDRSEVERISNKESRPEEAIENVLHESKHEFVLETDFNNEETTTYKLK